MTPHPSPSPYSSTTNPHPTLALTRFWRQTPADREARRLVTRLGLCSHALLYKQARNGGDDEKDELADLVR